MTRHSFQAQPALTRRRLVQHTVQGTAGLLAWHQGWADATAALAKLQRVPNDVALAALSRAVAPRSAVSRLNEQAVEGP